MLALGWIGASGEMLTYRFDIPEQPADRSLTLLAQQAKVPLLFSFDEVHDVTTDTVVGEYTLETALAQLLAGTNLKGEVNSHGVLTVTIGPEDAPVEGGTVMSSQNGDRSTIKRKGLLGVLAAVFSVGAGAQEVGDADGDEQELDEIVVTGTNIRGIAPESSPVRTFNREDIQTTGAATAQDFIRTLTQNFGGGANENFSTVPGDSSSGANDGFGSSVNIRGLGAGSTLVLLNGRRVAPASDIGGFVDISMIPASAIERVEILTDGASSIYGADAVAGVTNIVLRDDYDGLEGSLRYGTITEGDLDEYRTGLTGGKSWNSGNGLITYEYYKRDRLSAGDRNFSRDFLLPNDLLPRQERHSVIGSLTQQLSDNISFGGDILHSRRESLRFATGLGGIATGRRSRTDTVSDVLNIGGNMGWNVVRDWYVDVSGTYSEFNTSLDLARDGVLLQTRVSEADQWSLEAKGSGGVVELPGGNARIAVGVHYRQEGFVNTLDEGTLRRNGDREVYAIFGEGFIPVVGSSNAVPGIQRLELNISGRFEDYSDFGSSSNPKVGVLYSPADGLRFRGSYGTSFRPPSLGRAGALDRGATAASTSFVNGVFGVEAPDPSIADVVALFRFGTAQNLDAETSRAFSAGVDYDLARVSHDFSLSASYFDIEFEGRISATPMPNNENSLLAPNIAFTSPELFPEGTVVFFPSLAEVEAILDGLNFTATGILGVDPRDAMIISNVSIARNLSRTEVRGLDVELGYSFDGEFGVLNLGLDASYLFDFKQQGAVTTPIVEQLDTQFNPLDLNLRGRFGFSHDGFAANVFVNYADDYRVDSTNGAAPIDSWMTVDASISFETPERVRNSALQDTTLMLSVLNLFNDDPPTAPSVTGRQILGYDPTNASPLGRFVSFSVTKRF